MRRPFRILIRVTLFFAVWVCLLYVVTPAWGSAVLAWIDDNMLLFTLGWVVVLLVLLVPMFKGICHGIAEGRSNDDPA